MNRSMIPSASTANWFSGSLSAFARASADFSARSAIRSWSRSAKQTTGKVGMSPGRGPVLTSRSTLSIVLFDMKQDTLMFFLFVALALFVGWHLGHRSACLEAAHHGIRAAVSDHEKRLLPLEQDLQRRQKIRGNVSGLLSWL